MSCLTPSQKEIDDIRLKLKRSSTQILDKTTKLARGGVVIHSSKGNIQVGMPPETIKDCILQGVDIPSVYIVPTERFDRKYYVNVSEFEFPAYFNFFITRKKVRLICSKESEKALRIVFQETLLGPTSFEGFETEFSNTLPKGYIPDMKKELDHFAINPFTKEKLKIEALVEFINYDENNEAFVEDLDVKIKFDQKYFYIHEGDEVIAKVKDQVNLECDVYFAIQQLKKEKLELIKQNPKGNELNIEDPLGFSPPKFGISVLGNSHGFDAKGSTSGYILWVNGRGIMIDPPPFSSQGLKEFGIPPNMIDRCIVTHCHADHDSGCFQKILLSNRVEIVTSPTIMASFLRKYSALSGIPIDEFRNLFVFRPVLIGRKVDIAGASFKFFYSYHSIPALGFEVEYCGKIIYFSGDTFFDPEELENRYNQGIFNKERYESLAEINWEKYDLILHEAGVPPIHTSTDILKNFPEKIKNKLYLVHIAEKDVPEGCGLKSAKCGLSNTLCLDVKPNIDKTSLKLDILSSIEFLNDIPLYKARDLVRCCIEEEYMPGQVVIKEGTKGSKFYIVQKGIAKIFSVKPGKEFSKYALPGDYFGETALISEGFRNADVIAYTNLTVYVLDKNDFKWVFGIMDDSVAGIAPDQHTQALVDKLKGLTDTWKSKYSQFINSNRCFHRVSESQKTQISMFLKHHEVAEGEYLWKKGDQFKICLFLYKGTMLYITPGSKNPQIVKPGMLIGDFPAMSAPDSEDEEGMEEIAVCTSTLKARVDCEVLVISKKDMITFLSRNPGIKVLLRDKYMIL